MNQLAIALKSIPRCSICKQPLSPAENKLRVTAHFECIVLDVLTYPERKS